MKKKLFILLSLILFGISFNAKAYDFASINSNGDTIYYNITSSTSPYKVAVTYKGDMLSDYDEYKGSITIPSTVTKNNITYTVSSIDQFAFSDCDSLISINLPSTITEIGFSAFAECTLLTTISLPNSLKNIESSAFFMCYSLVSINIPSSVKNITSTAFVQCTRLTSINVDASNSNYTSLNGVLYDKTMDTLICCPGGTTGVFTIPSSVSVLAYAAFRTCIQLTSIIFPNSITKISPDTFMGCWSLNSLVVDSSNPNYSTLNGVLYNKPLTILILYPNQGPNPFVVPNSVKSIGYFAFNYCDNLNSITFPNTLDSISHSAFYYCDELTSINLPASVKLINDYAFYHCTALTSITSQATTPPIIYANTFKNVSKSIPLYVPFNSIGQYDAALYWRDFTNIQSLSGLNDISNNEIKATLYPNPATDKAILEVEGLNNNADVIVYDLQGRIIKTYKLNTNQTELEIDVNSLTKGIYNIKVINDKNSITKKLIVN